MKITIYSFKNNAKKFDPSVTNTETEHAYNTKKKRGRMRGGRHRMDNRRGS